MEVKLDIIAIIISVIAILASVICAVITFIQNYKINKINMKARYYNKIFDSYLIEKIPMSYRYLIFRDNKLSDSDKISDVLSPDAIIIVSVTTLLFSRSLSNSTAILFV